MNELMLTKDLEMTSLEVNDILNKFREEEGKSIKEHKTFMRDLRKEIQILENTDLFNEYKFVLVEKGYKDKKGEWRPYYILDRNALLLILNRESTIVRAKTIKYINALENRITEMNKEIMIQKQQNIIAQKDREITQLTQFIGLKSKAKFDWGKIIKTHLGIRKANADYECIKQIFFFEVGVRKWEDIYPSMQNVKLLRRICEEYQPSKQGRLF